MVSWHLSTATRETVLHCVYQLKSTRKVRTSGEDWECNDLRKQRSKFSNLWRGILTRKLTALNSGCAVFSNLSSSLFINSLASCHLSSLNAASAASLGDRRIPLFTACDKWINKWINLFGQKQQRAFSHKHDWLLTTSLSWITTWPYLQIRCNVSKQAKCKFI